MPEPLCPICGDNLAGPDQSPCTDCWDDEARPVPRYFFLPFDPGADDLVN